MEDRIVSGQVQEEERQAEQTLRPQRLGDLYGQEKVVRNLQVALSAARARGEALDHTLFYGPPGLGKTTLAHVIANEMGVHCKITAGPVIERTGDLAAILTNLKQGDILFIDEVHRLNRAVEEVLYPAMEDFALDLVVGKGPSARSIRLRLPRFTIIGATTRLALLTSPLRDRFGLVYHLDFYSLEAMEKIVRRSARILGIVVDDGGVQEIARRSRGTPRVANRLLKRVRDYAQVVDRGAIVDAAVARTALELLEVDELGLDETDRRVLRTIIEKFAGGPVGITTIAAATAEEPDTVEDVYEPYLLQLGFLQRTSRGRMATRLAYEHLGLPYPEEQAEPQQKTLW